jgi:hypothetical protein
VRVRECASVRTDTQGLIACVLVISLRQSTAFFFATTPFSLVQRHTIFRLKNEDKTWVIIKQDGMCLKKNYIKNVLVALKPRKILKYNEFLQFAVRFVDRCTAAEGNTGVSNIFICY